MRLRAFMKFAAVSFLILGVVGLAEAQSPSQSPNVDRMVEGMAKHLVQYTDSKGEIHYVGSMGQVPPEYRSRATAVTTVTDTELARVKGRVKKNCERAREGFALSQISRR